MKMSTAQQKVQDYRDQMNKGRTRILAKDFSSCIYMFDNFNGKPCIIGYHGRALKADFNFRYPSIEKRNDKIKSYMELWKKEKQEKVSIIRKLDKGDVLKSSWGYDQTNIDYYLVVGLVGKTSVSVVEIGKIISHDNIDTGSCAPDISKIVSDAKTYRVTRGGESIKISSCQWPSKMEPIETNVNTGLKIYKKSSWSAYH